MKIEEINIENLKVGSTYKNFKEVAKVLGYDKTPTGNSRIAIWKEIERYYEVERSGQKIKIIRKREKILPETRRVGNNIKYSEVIWQMLYNYAVCNKKEDKTWYTFSQTKMQWQLSLGLINEKYRDFARYMEGYDGCNDMGAKIVEDLEDQEFQAHEIQAFVLRTQQKLYSILFSALNVLEQAGKIEYRKTYEVNTGEKYECGTPNELDSGFYWATCDQETYIENVKEKMFQEYGVTSSFYLKSRRREFYKDLACRIYELTGWKFYNIIIVEIPNLPEEEMDRESEQYQQFKAEREELQRKLFAIVKKSLLDQVQKIVEKEPENFLKRWEQANKKMAIGRFPKSSIYRLPENFLEKQTALIEYFYSSIKDSVEHDISIVENIA